MAVAEAARLAGASARRHMAGMIVPRTRVILLLSVLLAASALGIAMVSEAYGLVPCALCLVERRPYWAIIAVGLVGLVLPRRPARVCVWLLVPIGLAAAAAAAVHVGVEQTWWPSPLPECAAPSFGGGTVAERLARMPLLPSKPCDDPTFLIPGLPVAAMNLAAALAFAAGLATFLWHTRRSGT
jgi:disulfide bond formation protein DsbB